VAVPWGIIKIAPIRHLSLAGDGQHTVPGQRPRQIAAVPFAATISLKVTSMIWTEKA